MVPVATEGRHGWFDTFTREYELNSVNIYKVDSFYVAISKDNKTVLGATYVGYWEANQWGGDSEEHIKNFPEPYNKIEWWQEKVLKWREWNKYLEKDVLSQTDPGALFGSGKAAALMRGLYGSQSILAGLKMIVPEAELAFFPYKSADREMVPGSTFTDYKVNNFGCIPVTSKKIDRTMAVIDWIFQSPENHDLFEYGLEGVHWIKKSESSYTFAENLGTQLYKFPWYQLSGNPSLYRYNDGMTDYEKQMYNWSKNEERYSLSTITGFTFNTEPVKDEKVKVDAINTKIEPALMCGAIEDPLQLIKDAYKDYQGVGLENLIFSFP